MRPISINIGVRMALFFSLIMNLLTLQICIFELPHIANNERHFSPSRPLTDNNFLFQFYHILRRHFQVKYRPVILYFVKCGLCRGLGQSLSLLLISSADRKKRRRNRRIFFLNSRPRTPSEPAKKGSEFYRSILQKWWFIVSQNDTNYSFNK